MIVLLCKATVNNLSNKVSIKSNNTKHFLNCINTADFQELTKNMRKCHFFLLKKLFLIICSSLSCNLSGNVMTRSSYVGTDSIFSSFSLARCSRQAKAMGKLRFSRKFPCSLEESEVIVCMNFTGSSLLSSCIDCCFNVNCYIGRFNGNW